MNESHNYKGEDGKVYNHWTVLSRDGKDRIGRWKWLCRCSCGTDRSVPGHYLRQGKSKHCGCVPRRATHKLTPEQVNARLTLPRECSKCHRVLPPEDFGMVAVRHWCRDCKSEHARNHSKIHGRRHWLLDKYGITPEQYAILFASQDGKCAICLRIPDEDNKANVDHDHSGNTKRGEPGFVRGILCMQCNIGIGKFGDNVEMLQKAIRYLQKDKIVLDNLK